MQKIFLLILILSISIDFVEGKSNKKLVDQVLTLRPDKCIITGEENNTVITMDGERTVLGCTLGPDRITCGQMGKSSETYETILEDGVFISRSQSGNIYILGNLNKKRYSISSNHVIPEKGMLMTKHCTGVIVK